MSIGWVELVVCDGSTLNFVRVVEPNIGDFTTVFEDVVGDGHVVCSDLTGAVAVVVWRTFVHDTNATVNESVAVNEVAVATVHDDTDIVVVDGVVEFGVALIVDERAVCQLEEVQLVLVVVAVAHRTNDVRNTGDGGVVHVKVERVVAVANVESLRHASTRNSNGGDSCIVHVE